MENSRYVIGIDTGTNTGYAVYDTISKKLTVETLKIHQAMFKIHRLPGIMLVRVEDARLRKWFGDKEKGSLQGVGGIKRDAKIWEDFLTDNAIPFEMVAPKDNMTKLPAKSFKQFTGYKGRTSQHGRDAAGLLFKYMDFENNNIIIK